LVIGVSTKVGAMETTRMPWAACSISSRVRAASQMPAPA
jgi:hypothetical protein